MYSKILKEKIDEVLFELHNYIDSTNNDKYESESYIDTQKMMLEGTGEYQLMNVAKYLRRYNSKGYEKSQNINDLFKALHYIMIEIARRKHNADL
jgi:hypothetical protein